MSITPHEILQLQKKFNELLQGVVDGAIPLTDAHVMLDSALTIQPDSVRASRSRQASRFLDVCASPEEQVACLCEWNRSTLFEYFEEAKIMEMVAAAPDFSWDQPLRALTLCFSLDDPTKTVAAYIEIMQRVYADHILMLSHEMKDLALEDIRLPVGAPGFAPNRLWWTIVDLGAKSGEIPTDIDPTIAAGIEVFGVACQHPLLMKGQLSVKRSPVWCAPGLRVWLPMASSSRVPSIQYRSGGISIGSQPPSQNDRGLMQPIIEAF